MFYLDFCFVLFCFRDFGGASVFFGGVDLFINLLVAFYLLFNLSFVIIIPS